MHHFAHACGQSCDPWRSSDGMGPWHRRWQAFASNEFLEVTIVKEDVKHIAEVVKGGTLCRPLTTRVGQPRTWRPSFGAVTIKDGFSHPLMPHQGPGFGAGYRGAAQPNPYPGGSSQGGYGSWMRHTKARPCDFWVATSPSSAPLVTSGVLSPSPSTSTHSRACSNPPSGMADAVSPPQSMPGTFSCPSSGRRWRPVWRTPAGHTPGSSATTPYL